MRRSTLGFPLDEFCETFEILGHSYFWVGCLVGLGISAFSYFAFLRPIERNPNTNIQSLKEYKEKLSENYRKVDNLRLEKKVNDVNSFN